MIFLNSVSSAAALVYYLPTGVCTHTDTEGKQSQEYFKIFGKNTIFNEHPVELGREYAEWISIFNSTYNNYKSPNMTTFMIDKSFIKVLNIMCPGTRLTY